MTSFYIYIKEETFTFKAEGTLFFKVEVVELLLL